MPQCCIQRRAASSTALPFTTIYCGERLQNPPDTWVVKNPSTCVAKLLRPFNWLSTMPLQDHTPNTSAPQTHPKLMRANAASPCETPITLFTHAPSFCNKEGMHTFDTFSLRDVFNKHPDRLLAFLKHPSYIYQPPLPSQCSGTVQEEVVEGIG